MLDGIKFIRYCQNLQRQSIFNYRKLKTFKKSDLSGDILKDAANIGVAPVMVVRHLLELEGCTKNIVRQIVRTESPPPNYLKDALEIALQNDPVFSPKGIQYGKKRGKLGEELIGKWLDSLSIGYDRDLGQGGPDFLLKCRLNVDISGTISEFDWIESKASYGDAYEIRHNHKQFDRYDFFGYGIVFYWYGAEPNNKYEIFTWETMLDKVDPTLKKEILAFISFVPPEFKHLIA